MHGQTHILYSANCINSESQPLLIHLPQLVPTDRLGSITSLEVTKQLDNDGVYYMMDRKSGRYKFGRECKDLDGKFKYGKGREDR